VHDRFGFKGRKSFVQFDPVVQIGLNERTPFYRICMSGREIIINDWKKTGIRKGFAGVAAYITGSACD